MVLDVFSDVSVRQPRADDAKRGNFLRNSEEWYDVRMRNVLPSHNLRVEHLIGVWLSSPRVGIGNCHTPVSIYPDLPPSGAEKP